MRQKYFGFIIILFLSFSSGLIAQVSEEKIKVPNTSKREEIQRYAGFEDLPIMYLTLGSDNFFAANMNRSFMDIGFVILLLLPLLLIWKKTQAKGLQWGIALFSFSFLLLLSLPSAIYNYHDLTLGTLSEYIGNYTYHSNPIFSSAEKIVHSFVSLTGPFYEKIILWLRSWETPYGKWTYPFLIFSFLGFLFFVSWTVNKKSKEVRFLVVTFLLVGFLWILFSSGIIWYGLALFPLSTLLIFYGWEKMEPWKKTLLLVFVLLQISFHLPYRYARYYDTDKSGGLPLESAVSAYQTRQIEKPQYISLLTGVPQELLNYLNLDLSAKIYRSGTNLHFFILQNDQRVFEDNQFGRLEYFFGKNDEFRLFLKNKGFRFVILDLAMGSMDTTPEQSLKSKQEKAIELVRQTPGLRLLYTDRVILDRSKGLGQQGLGTEDSKIIRNGKLAIFEVL